MKTDLDTKIMELRTIREQVNFLLGQYPETRNNDFYLVLLWMKTFGGLEPYIKWIPYELIKDLSGKVKSVTRMRRKLQNDYGLHPPTDPVKYARWKENQLYREAINKI